MIPNTDWYTLHHKILGWRAAATSISFSPPFSVSFVYSFFRIYSCSQCSISQKFYSLVSLRLLHHGKVLADKPKTTAGYIVSEKVGSFRALSLSSLKTWWPRLFKLIRNWGVGSDSNRQIGFTAQRPFGCMVTRAPMKKFSRTTFWTNKIWWISSIISKTTFTTRRHPQGSKK